MNYRCFNISIRDGEGVATLDKEYTIQIPDCDMTAPTERADHLGIMCDALIAVSGVEIESFQYNEVTV
jgi:hypothetical protein